MTVVTARFAEFPAPPQRQKDTVTDDKISHSGYYTPQAWCRQAVKIDCLTYTLFSKQQVSQISQSSLAMLQASQILDLHAIFESVKLANYYLYVDDSYD